MSLPFPVGIMTAIQQAILAEQRSLLRCPINMH
jgi:hypothetical protein